MNEILHRFISCSFPCRGGRAPPRNVSKYDRRPMLRRCSSACAEVDGGRAKNPCAPSSRRLHLEALFGFEVHSLLASRKQYSTVSICAGSANRYQAVHCCHPGAARISAPGCAPTPERPWSGRRRDVDRIDQLKGIALQRRRNPDVSRYQIQMRAGRSLLHAHLRPRLRHRHQGDSTIPRSGSIDVPGVPVNRFLWFA